MHDSDATDSDAPDSAAPSSPRRPAIPVLVRAMREADIEAVSKIERRSFETAWSAHAYVTELANPAAVYVVAEQEGSVIGYGGLWVIMDEAHITTVAVNPELRGQGIGERLLSEMLAVALHKGATRATLEVRESNAPAQNLYKKYGFQWVAIRKAYYSDNGENADILWLNHMDAPEWRQQFDERRAALWEP